MLKQEPNQRGNQRQAINSNQSLFDAIFNTRKALKLAKESHSNYKQLKIKLSQKKQPNE